MGNQFYKQVQLAVEATPFEKERLFAEFQGRLEWQDLDGTTTELVGSLDGENIFISISLARINNCMVMFHHSPSEVVDRRQIRAWLKKNCPRLTSELDFLHMPYGFKMGLQMIRIYVY